ncbi:unnamed protein product [Mucor hiemalis]
MAFSILVNNSGELGGVSTDESSSIPSYPQLQHPSGTFKANDYYMPSPPSSNTAFSNQTSLYDQSQLDPTTALTSTYYNCNRGSEIDFNSLEFLYNTVHGTGLFGQVVFDVNSGNASASQIASYPPQQPLYQTMMQSATQSLLSTATPIDSPSSSKPTTSSAFQPIAHQNSSPTTYNNPSKSLWN